MDTIQPIQQIGADAPFYTPTSPPAAALRQTLASPGNGVEVVDDIAGLEALAVEWQHLEALSGPNSVFQSHAQVIHWARHFLTPSSANERLHIAIARQGERPVLIVPLVISGMPLARTARLVGDPLAQYSDVLVDPAADVNDAFEAALASAAAAGANAVVFRKLRADSHLRRLASGRLGAATDEQVAPYVDLSGYRDYNSFLLSLSKKMRQGLRNRQNHLDKSGEVTFELLEGGDAAREALDDAMRLKRRWLIQRGSISSAFLDPATRDCLLDLAGDQKRSGAVVMRLLVNGEPAAIRFGFEYRGTHFAYMSAYDESFAQLSPGKMLMNFYISRCKDRGIERIDMLPPSGRHKSDWCAHEAAVADYTLPLTVYGRVYAQLYREQLRPALRRNWLRLPEAIRSLAAALFITI